MLLDDELPGLTYLKMLCEQINELEVVKAFNDPALFLREWEELDFDLLISDIEMPGVKGLEIADTLKNKAVIFTTAYKDFAIEAYDKDVVDYIVKPIKKERLQQAVKKVKIVLKKNKIKQKQIHFNTDRGKALINIDKIFCITTSDIDSRDKIIIMDDLQKIILKNYSFASILKMLSDDDFCRINKSAVIALKNVRFFSHDEITSNVLQDNGRPFSFPLSEIYKEAFMAKIGK